MLDEGGARIILLVAPAGYGKTTLAREWLDERRAAWYQGGPASADVAALAVGLATAAAEIVPGAGDRMRQRLRATDRPEEDAQILAEMLAEDLAEWPEDAWLAIDDYHFASDAIASEEFGRRNRRTRPGTHPHHKQTTAKLGNGSPPFVWTRPRDRPSAARNERPGST